MIATIPQNHCRIIERFGKPIAVQPSGLAFRIPFLDTVRNVSADWGEQTNKQGVFIELSEQILDTKPRECLTKDNAKVLVDAIISWRLVDPIKAVYEVDHLHQSLLQATLNALRSEIGARSLDEVISARTILSEKIVSDLSDTSRKWGIQIVRVEVQELKTDSATGAAMLQQLEAERRSRAIAMEADGVAAAAIKSATAESEASIIRARGFAMAMEITALAEKSYLDTLAQTVGFEIASQLLLSQKVVEGLDKISKNPANKVFIPSNVKGILEMK
jgi:regulator of protease activity HflC (stomatin/prohibitin superfamily)